MIHGWQDNRKKNKTGTRYQQFKLRFISLSVTYRFITIPFFISVNQTFVKRQPAPILFLGSHFDGLFIPNRNSFIEELEKVINLEFFSSVPSKSKCNFLQFPKNAQSKKGLATNLRFKSVAESNSKYPTMPFLIIILPD